MSQNIHCFVARKVDNLKKIKTLPGQAHPCAFQRRLLPSVKQSERKGKQILS
jgi:hypothetical protein